MSNNLGLLNISDFNNQWNNVVLKLARDERAAHRDKLMEMASEQVSLIDLGDVTFQDFYESRHLGIVARNRYEFRAKTILKCLAKPLFFLAYHEFRDIGIPYRRLN